MQRLSNLKIYEYAGRPSTLPTARISAMEASNVCWLMINGSITQDTVRAFRLAASDVESRACKEKWVILQSPGGVIAPAFEIGRTIRDKGYNTTLEKGLGNCSSACGLIFISGVKRELPFPLMAGSLGFHQPSIVRAGKRVCQPESSTASSAILKFALSMLNEQAAKSFHEKVMATDCSRIRSYSYAEIVEIGIATAIGGPDVF